MSKLIEQLEAKRSHQLKYLRGRGIPLVDVEDMCQEVYVELLTYYSDTDDEKKGMNLFRMAANSQISKYYEGRGNVATPRAELNEASSGLTFDQLFSAQKGYASNPLDVCLKDTETEDFEGLIVEFSQKENIRKVLRAVYMEGLAPSEIVGVSRNTVHQLCHRFIKQVDSCGQVT